MPTKITVFLSTNTNHQGKTGYCISTVRAFDMTFPPHKELFQQIPTRCQLSLERARNQTSQRLQAVFSNAEQINCQATTQNGAGRNPEPRYPLNLRQFCEKPGEKQAWLEID